MNSTIEFTVEQGIAVQREQLDHWKYLLKPEIYADLEKWATSKNPEAKKGDDIPRGVVLDNFIQNLHYNKRNLLIEKKKELRELIAEILERHPELEGRIGEISSISYDNVNVDTDLQDCIQAIESIQTLGEEYKMNNQNQITR